MSAARARIHAMVNLDEHAERELDARLDEHRVEVLAEAAAFVGNDDTCDCGGCGTCVPRSLADGLRAMAGEKATAPATATPGFFQPGHAYTREHHGDTIRFLVEHVSTSPDGRTRVAHGWRNRSWEPGWEPSDSDDFTLWTDVTEAGEPS